MTRKRYKYQKAFTSFCKYEICVPHCVPLSSEKKCIWSYVKEKSGHLVGDWGWDWPLTSSVISVGFEFYMSGISVFKDIKLETSRPNINPLS